MLPAITYYARLAFRGLDQESVDEAVAEVVANAWVAFARLAELGKTDLAFATVLARYGVARFRDGRRVGSRSRVRDVMSEHARRQMRIKVRPLCDVVSDEGSWQDAVLHDTRRAPVPDIVAFRCDFPAWLNRHSRRDRRIAEALAVGNSTRVVARRFNISAARVSQLRRQFYESWQDFHGELVP